MILFAKKKTFFTPSTCQTCESQSRSPFALKLKKIELNQSKVLSLADLNQQVFLDALIQESVKMNTIAKSDKEVN